MCIALRSTWRPPADVETEPFHGFAAEQCSRYEAPQATFSGER
jgi:hypothetical protein